MIVQVFCLKKVVDSELNEINVFQFNPEVKHIA